MAQGGIPRMVIWGAEDRINPASRNTLAVFGGDQREIADAGHLPHIEAARQVNGLIAAFLKADRSLTMAKLRRGTQSAFADDASLRLRAAWLYHGHGLTQNQVAEQLGIGRTTVIRLLEESRKRGEVKIWIEDGEAGLVELAVALEQHYGIDEVIVVPAQGGAEQAATSVGLALGKFLSETIQDNTTIGVGWGRTLTASLASFHPPRHSGIRVMSLLGGSVETRFANPVEFSWRLAGALDAACYLFPAPLVVDSAETRRRLIEDCGLDQIYALAEAMDLAIISVGDINRDSTSLVRHLISPALHDQLVDLGCVGDVMCNFLDGEGRTVDHPVNERIMSIGLDTLARARHKLIATGGKSRAPALLAAIRRIGCNTLITDELAARALLDPLRRAPPERNCRLWQGRTTSSILSFRLQTYRDQPMRFLQLALIVVGLAIAPLQAQAWGLISPSESTMAFSAMQNAGRTADKVRTIKKVPSVGILSLRVPIMFGGTSYPEYRDLRVTERGRHQQAAQGPGRQPGDPQCLGQARRSDRDRGRRPRVVERFTAPLRAAVTA